MELYKKYRPEKLEDVVGQDTTVSVLKKMLQSKKTTPHAMLITGPSGCGKTTLARIIARHLKVEATDLREINAADNRGIELVRDIKSTMSLASMMSGGSRMWIIDEAHCLTKDAQSAFLKVLEEPPAHVYFALATTDPNKLISTIRNRTTEIKCSAISSKQLTTLLEKVAKAEKFKLTEDVKDALVEAADGSARKALVMLEQVTMLPDEASQLNSVSSADAKRAGIDLAKLLMNPRSQWGEVAKLLKGIDDEPETTRRIVLGYAKAILLGGGSLSARSYLVINSFRDNFFDGGAAALAAACYEIVTNK